MDNNSTIDEEFTAEATERWITEIQKEFKKYKLSLIRDFINTFATSPESGKNVYLNIKTSDKFTISVWGKSYQDILEQFKRFINLRIFI